MTDDDIEASVVALAAEDHWNKTHRKRWLLRRAAFSVLLVATGLAVYMAA